MRYFRIKLGLSSSDKMGYLLLTFWSQTFYSLWEAILHIFFATNQSIGYNLLIKLEMCIIFKE